MNKNRKEVYIALVLLLLTLCSGFVIQGLLARKEALRMTREAEAAITQVLGTVKSSVLRKYLRLDKLN